LASKLRTSDRDAASGAVEEMARIVEHIRSRWPEVKITIRGDSGFAREELMAWCETHGVDYLLGLAKNSRLIAEIAAELEAAKTQSEESGTAVRVFRTFVIRHVRVGRASGAWRARRSTSRGNRIRALW